MKFSRASYFLNVLACLVLCADSLAAPASSQVTLEDAFQAAQKKNETFRQSEEAAVQAQADLSAGRGGLFPRVDFRLQHTIQEELTDPLFRQFSPPRQSMSYLTATQPIFRGGREYFGLSALTHQRDAADEAVESARILLYQQVAESYLNVLLWEQDVKTLAEQLAIQKERAAELKGRSQRGESTQSEYISAQTQEASAQADLRNARASLANAREAFKFHTGLGTETEVVDPGLLKDPKKRVQSLDTYLKETEKRPDLLAAVSTATAAHRMVSGAWGNHLPELTAVGNYYFTRPSPFQDISWDVRLELNVPIFAGGTTHAAVQKASSQRQAADLQLEKARRMAQQEVRTYYETLVARLEQVNVLKESVALAEKNIRISQHDYRRGLVRSIDVQLVLADYRNIRRSYDQARFSAQVDLIKLESAAAVNLPQKK